MIRDGYRPPKLREIGIRIVKIIVIGGEAARKNKIETKMCVKIEYTNIQGDVASLPPTLGKVMLSSLPSVPIYYVI